MSLSGPPGWAGLVLLAWVAACGSDGGPATTGGPAPLPSGPGPAPIKDRCNRSAPFGEPVPLGKTINTIHAEIDGRMSPDLRTLYFARGSGGRFGIQVATRPSEDAEFGEPTPLPASVIPEGFVHSAPAIDADGLRLVFASSQDTRVQQVWATSRADLGSPWGPPVRLLPSSSGADTAVYLADGGRALYFYRTDGVRQHEMLVSRRGTDGAYGAPVAVPGVPLSEDLSLNSNPVLTDDERILYFANRATPSATRIRIHRATRADRSAPFGPAEPFDELLPRNELSGFDRVTWVSDDDCVVVLAGSRDREGSPDLHVAKRPR